MNSITSWKNTFINFNKYNYSLNNDVFYHIAITAIFTPTKNPVTRIKIIVMHRLAQCLFTFSKLWSAFNPNGFF